MDEKLYDACQNGNVEIVRSLIEKGTKYSHHLLNFIIETGNVEMVRIMIAKGTIRYNDALYVACRCGNIEMARLLIEKGANDFNSGLYRAYVNGKIEIVKLMIEEGANTIDQYYAFPKDKNDIKTLLSSLSLKVFEKIEGYDKLVNIIKERENNIICIMNNFIDSDINNFLLKEYISNDIYI